MKKLLILALAVVLVLGTCACSDGADEDSSTESLAPTCNYDYVPQYALNGEITGLDVHIGMNTDEVRALYKGTETSSAVPTDAYNFSEITKNGLTKMSCMSYYYYCYENAEDKGILAIADLGDAYGFKNGISISSDVKSVCGESESYIPEDSELFFFPATPDSCTTLSYQYDKYTVKFFFVSDYLAATFIYDNTVFQYPVEVTQNDD